LHITVNFNNNNFIPLYDFRVKRTWCSVYLYIQSFCIGGCCINVLIYWYLFMYTDVQRHFHITWINRNTTVPSLGTGTTFVLVPLENWVHPRYLLEISVIYWSFLYFILSVLLWLKASDHPLVSSNFSSIYIYTKNSRLISERCGLAAFLSGSLLHIYNYILTRMYQ